MVARPSLMPSKLDYARQAALAQVQAQVTRTGPSSTVVRGVLLEVESSPAWRALVDVMGGEVWLPATAGAYVVGGGVHVRVEGGKPTWVDGPTDTPVPDAPGPSTVAEGAVPFVLNPAAMLDQEARDAANDVVTRIGRAFVTSLDAPTPQDGQDRPNGAIWTRTNPDGTPAARWKWDATEGAWTSVGLDVEIFSEAFIDTLATNEMFGQRLTLTSEVDGWLTRVSGLGLETFNPDGLAAIQLGNFDDNYMQLATSDGMVGVSIDQEGGVNAITGSFGESLRYRGTELEDRLQDTARLVAWGGDTPDKFGVITTPGGERALFELVAESGDDFRYWEFCTSPILLRVGGSGNVGIRVRYTADGSTPGLGSPILAYDQKTTNWTGDGFVTCHIPYRPITPGSSGTWRLLVNMYSNGPGLAVERASGNNVWARIIDLGAVKERSFVLRNDYVSRDDPAPTPTPTPSKKRYSNVPFSKTWHKVWQEDGQAPGAAQSSVIQGRTPYFPAAGIYRSMVGFESMTTALSGAEIESIQVRVRAEHWYSHAGGRVDIGLHGASSSTAPGSFTELVHGVVSGRLGIGGEVWLTIPREYYAGFRNGTYRGVTVYRASADPVDYGKFTASRFAIRATYVK